MERYSDHWFVSVCVRCEVILGEDTCLAVVHVHASVLVIPDCGLMPSRKQVLVVLQVASLLHLLRKKKAIEDGTRGSQKDVLQAQL